MQIRSASAVVALGLASFAHGQDPVQWSIEDGGNGHWYQCRWFAPALSWSVLRATAVNESGYLVTITSAGENSFVYDLSLASDAWLTRRGPMLGAMKAGGCGGMQWVTGEAFGYANWLPGEPNGGCVEPILGFIGPIGSVLPSDRWNDYPDPISFESVSAVFEWSADCNGDGIVDFGQCRDGSLRDYNTNNVPDCCEAAVACEYQPVHWPVAAGGNGHWYQRRAKVGDWFACRSEALSIGGDLASIASASEDAVLAPLVPLQNPPVAWNRTFVGGAQPVGSPANEGWRWSDGTPWSFSNWYYNQPNGGEGFLTLMNDAGVVTWGDYGTNSADINWYIVEWSADCDGNGVVDYGEILDGTLADTNANGVPDCCDAGVSCDPCPGDLNQSGTVDAEDLACILFAWGTDGGKTPDADIDHSGTVDANDLSVVLGSWGPCP